ncbi:MAG: hypothetical protein AB1758_00440 [Candidatus Eremiobacterota bacterium]
MLTRMKELVRDLKEVHSAFGWVTLVLSLSSVGLVPCLLQLLEPYRTFGEMVLLTAPLTFSVVLLTLTYARGWLDDVQGITHLFVVSLAIIVPYLIAAGWGLVEQGPAPGLDQWRWLQYLSPGRLLGLTVSVLCHYFTSYGLARTLGSLTCGFFLAWVLQTRVLPARSPFKFS